MPDKHIFDKDTGFYDFNQYMTESYMELTSLNGEYDIKYPISYLTDALGGMLKSELMIIGADSGIGKTEIVNKIAYLNAMNKKNVYVFSLEGDKYEFANRCRYGYYLAHLKESRNWGLYCSYRDFLMNRIPEAGQTLLDGIDKQIVKELGTLKVYSREQDLTIERFESHLERIKDRADLIIIDHLHYFEFSKREYDAINEIMKRLKKIQDRCRVPIILVSHLRKKDKQRVFPDQEDFHGSSNIVKQADTCVLLGHVDLDEEQDIASGKYKTGVRIVKSRTGFPGKILGILEYDLETRKYSKEYTLALCGSHYMSMMKEKPKWAKYGKIQAGDEKKESGTGF